MLKNISFFLILIFSYISLYVWLRNESILIMTYRGWGNEQLIYSHVTWVTEDGSSLPNHRILNNNLSLIAYYVFYPLAIIELQIKNFNKIRLSN